MAISDITYPGAGGSSGHDLTANFFLRVEAFAETTNFLEFFITINGIESSLNDFLVPGTGYNVNTASPAPDTEFVVRALIPTPELVEGFRVTGDSLHADPWTINWFVTGVSVNSDISTPATSGPFDEAYPGVNDFSNDTPLTVILRA